MARRRVAAQSTMKYALTMTLPLLACSSCGRHVRSETACPFCAAPLDSRKAAARVALAVALATGGAVATGCFGAVYGGPPPGYNRGGLDASAGADPDAGATTDDAAVANPPVEPTPTTTRPPGPAPMYGAPPPPERP